MILQSVRQICEAANAVHQCEQLRAVRVRKRVHKSAPSYQVEEARGSQGTSTLPLMLPSVSFERTPGALRAGQG